MFPDDGLCDIYAAYHGTFKNEPSHDEMSLTILQLWNVYGVVAQLEYDREIKCRQFGRISTGSNGDLFAPLC